MSFTEAFSQYHFEETNSQCFLSNKISGLKEVPGITWEHLCYDGLLAPEPRIPEAEELINSLS